MAGHSEEFRDLVPGDTAEEREANKKLAFSPGPWEAAVVSDANDSSNARNSP